MRKFSLLKMVCIIFVICAAAIASPAQNFTTLHRFNSTDGRASTAAVIQASDENFYGTTAGGGNFQAGTVFKITPAGVLTTLYSFCSQTNCTNGAGPRAGLIQATDGNFYGTTSSGGGGQSSGTVFSPLALRWSRSRPRSWASAIRRSTSPSPRQ